MIDKVIIAEDHESSNLSILKVIEDLKIKQADYAFYCDDAYNKVRVALQKNSPYDLLITHLLFEDDGTDQRLRSGFDLIRAVREIQPAIRVLVFTGEDRPLIVNKLFEKYEVDAYVRKARHDVRELKSAFDALSKGQQYLARPAGKAIKQSNTYEFSEFDIRIIQLLSKGFQQKDIPDYLKQHNIKPSSLSSIEKRLNQIREELGFLKNEQLVLFCKDAGVL